VSHRPAITALARPLRPTEAWLVEAEALCRAGNLAAFVACLYPNCHLRLVHFAARLLRDRNLAEDVVSDVWVKLLEGKYDPAKGGALRAFLFTVVRNQCCDVLRRRRRERTCPVPFQEKVGSRTAAVGEDAPPSPEECLERCLGVLEPREREVVVSFYLRRETYEEIERKYRLLLSRAGFASWRHRIRKRLRRQCAPLTAS
jgi:RNA polymerase sigma-70 factor (ECF subfamily)